MLLMRDNRAATYGYATTTTTTGALSFPTLSNIILENIGIFPGLYKNNGTMGESLCPLTMNPNFLNPELKYLALNANLRNLSLPSVPFINAGGRFIDAGRRVDGAGP